jgi:hypothetical protein
VYRPPLAVLAPIHMGDPQRGRGRRVAVARCCEALEGRRVDHLPAHLGDDGVPPVAASVSEQRGNEPKCLPDLLGTRCAQSPERATSDTESCDQRQ